MGNQNIKLELEVSVFLALGDSSESIFKNKRLDGVRLGITNVN